MDNVSPFGELILVVVLLCPKIKVLFKVYLGKREGLISVENQETWLITFTEMTTHQCVDVCGMKFFILRQLHFISVRVASPVCFSH